MIRILKLLVSLAFFAACTTSNPKEAKMSFDKPTKMERMGMYVVSNDLMRSSEFYEAIFQKQPDIRTDVFIGFDIAGGLFAIASKQQFAASSKIGGNAVPYIQVSDIEASFRHVKAVAPEAVSDSEVINEEYLSLFKFVDPDGNMVEYYSLN